jgi:hypothetical protein
MGRKVGECSVSNLTLNEISLAEYCIKGGRRVKKMAWTWLSVINIKSHLYSVGSNKIPVFLIPGWFRWLASARSAEAGRENQGVHTVFPMIYYLFQLIYSRRQIAILICHRFLYWYMPEVYLQGCGSGLIEYGSGSSILAQSRSTKSLSPVPMLIRIHNWTFKDKNLFHVFKIKF